MNPVDPLRSLTPREPSRDLDARVLRCAHEELRAGREESRWLAIPTRMAARIAIRAAVTATVAVTVVGYLHWAVSAASALYR